MKGAVDFVSFKRSKMAKAIGSVVKLLSKPVFHAHGKELGRQMAKKLALCQNTKTFKHEVHQMNSLSLRLEDSMRLEDGRRMGEGLQDQWGRRRKSSGKTSGGKKSGAKGGFLVGMAMKVLNPLLDKLPKAVSFLKPVVVAVVPYLINGDIKGAIAELKKQAGKVAATKAMGFLKPILAKLPLAKAEKDVIAKLIKDAISQLLMGNIKGAMSAVKRNIIKFGVMKIKGLVKTISGKLPAVIKTPAENFVMGIINDYAAKLGGGERGVKRARERIELGQSTLEVETATTDEEAGNMVKMIVTQALTFVSGAIPAVVTKMTGMLPSSFDVIKPPLKDCLSAIFTKSCGVMQNPTNWGDKGKTEVIKLVVAEVKKLALKLVAVGKAKITALIRL